MALNLKVLENERMCVTENRLQIIEPISAPCFGTAHNFTALVPSHSSR